MQPWLLQGREWLTASWSSSQPLSLYHLVPTSLSPVLPELSSIAAWTAVLGPSGCSAEQQDGRRVPAWLGVSRDVQVYRDPWQAVQGESHCRTSPANQTGAGT